MTIHAIARVRVPGQAVAASRQLSQSIQFNGQPALPARDWQLAPARRGKPWVLVRPFVDRNSQAAARWDRSAVDSHEWITLERQVQARIGNANQGPPVDGRPMGQWRVCGWSPLSVSSRGLPRQGCEKCLPLASHPLPFLL